ncbi:putative GINS complex subunit Psf3 [Toxoplasma gondii MAS]|uniref:Putative GINS complex subunit Psf3 n=1 Tax=Toxoplasma gondii MAS TaxID=943118 RepID=A0A086PML0_TOXGO|nr:putative GINS complex subunit Psf3 [Toxoplasma gondii MAS]
MAFFDPFLSNRDGRRDSNLGAPLDPDEEPASLPSASAATSSSPSSCPVSLPAADAGDASHSSSFSEDRGESSLEDSAPAFDLKAFHRHVRDADSFDESSQAAAHAPSLDESRENTCPSNLASIPHLPSFGGDLDEDRAADSRKGEARARKPPPRSQEGDELRSERRSATPSAFASEAPSQGSLSQADASWLDVPGPSWEALDQEARREPFRFIDFEVVPCTPVTELPYLSSLCPNAQQEVAKKMRPDVLRPADSLQLPLYQAELLMGRGKMKIKFPSFYEIAIIDALIKDPLTVDLAAHCLFYFDLGLHLCSLLPPYEWPVQHLQETLRNARHRRRVHIITHHKVLEKQFIGRLTFPEVCILKELQKDQAGPRGPFGG